MDRYWLLTWTTYATWLPGDPRGFVANIAGPDGHGVRHNQPGMPYAANIPGLRSYAAARLSGPPVRLTHDQVTALVEQFRETAGHRGWMLLAAAVMRNHIHLVVGVPGDPEPDTLLRDFKSYASRRLNELTGRRERWWTQSGSKRKLPNEAAVAAAVRYVRNQEFPLAVWLSADRSCATPFIPRELPVNAGCLP